MSQQITRSEFVWLIHQAIRNEHPRDCVRHGNCELDCEESDCKTCKRKWPCNTIELLDAYTNVDLSPFYRTAAAASADHRERYRRILDEAEAGA